MVGGEESASIGLEALKTQLRQLELKRGNAIKPEDWTETDRLSLLNLQKQLEQLKASTTKPVTPELGKRQTVAGTVVNGVRQPELTQQESQTIANATNTRTNQGQRGK